MYAPNNIVSRKYEEKVTEKKAKTDNSIIIEKTPFCS